MDDQKKHLRSLIKALVFRRKKRWLLGYSQSAYLRLWSDYADVQADLSLWWVDMPTCTFHLFSTHFSAVLETFSFLATSIFLFFF